MVRRVLRYKYIYNQVLRLAGGEGGIRTLDTGLSPYTPLAGERLRPLGHLSAKGRKIREYSAKIKRRSCASRGLLPVQMLYAARAPPTPCIFHQSPPKS